MIFEILIIILLIIVNGLLAISEMAVTSSRKSRLQQLTKEGNSGANVALELANEPTRSRSAVEIWIVMLGTLVGVLGGLTLADNLTLGLKQINLIVLQRKTTIKIARTSKSKFLILLSIAMS
ncbi:Uncharacterised protein [uncultured archaeon]|nr:Uncharacterised protein [uncultured archaeon]